MTKDIDTHKMRRGLLNKSDRLFIKSFNGATTEDMNSYVLPAKRHKNDLYVIHTGTNDLRSDKGAEEICKNIIKLATFLKEDENDVIISGIIGRNDDYNLKGEKVNESLKSLCSENNIGFINNNNICKSRHINGSGLHLNKYGTVTFANNLLDAINL